MQSPSNLTPMLNRLRLKFKPLYVSKANGGGGVGTRVGFRVLACCVCE